MGNNQCLPKMKLFLSAAVLTCFLLIGRPAYQAAEAACEDKLFDPSRVHNIEISMAEEDWEDLKANPVLKTKYHADITIDGEAFGNVSCAAKGNSSLKKVAEEGNSTRYSLRIKFSKYDPDQTYYGLSSISLNNSFMDSTYVKDFLSYTMFRKAGADAPLCSYAWIKVNGEDYGLYLAVEDIEESFLERTGRAGGVLYKPDSDKLDAEIDLNEVVWGDYSEGAELSYRGEAVEDYPDIFEHTETKAGTEDYLRVIAALKALSEDQSPEEYLDTDEIIKYFAVHNFIENFDSYTGPMLHNYFLCEKDGKLSLFPWDYNLAFGVFWDRLTDNEADIAYLLNLGIDTPLLGADEEKRPMWKWIRENESFRGRYHEAADKFIGSYFESGVFKEETDAVYEMLLPWVKKDPTAFFTPEEYSASFRNLQDYCLLRAESYRRQLDGRLSMETDSQLPADRVDPGDLTFAGLT